MPIPSLGSSAWDRLWLGGARFPGNATVGGPGVKRKLDVKNPKGASGASLKDEGDELGRIDIKLFLWEDEQVAELERLLPDIHPRRKGGPKSPLDIYHPASAAVGINQIYIDQLPIFEHDKARRTLTVTFKAIEWVPAPKPQKKGAGGGKGGGNKNDDLKSFNDEKYKVGEVEQGTLGGWGEKADEASGAWDDFKNQVYGE